MTKEVVEVVTMVEVVLKQIAIQLHILHMERVHITLDQVNQIPKILMPITAMLLLLNYFREEQLL